MANTDSSHLFCLADNDAFGFDLDCTLAMFNLVDSFKLTHDSMVEYLIEEKGYSQALREDIEVDVDFCTKGLVLDQRKGNFLKLAYDGSILRLSWIPLSNFLFLPLDEKSEQGHSVRSRVACHGTRVMSIGEIEKIYGKDKQFGRFSYLKEHVASEQDHFRVFETYFDVPGSVISARIVDIQDKAAGKPLDSYSFWDDVFAAFINCYRYQAFAENSGGFFPGIKTSPKKYYRKCSDEVKNWVKSLRSQKKFVFLMTSSYPDFGKHTLQQVFGDQWQSYFDLYLFYARKPSFFTTTRPFLRLDGDVEKEPVVDMEANQCYSQGNVQQLNAFLGKVTGKTDPKVVYFGDSLRSDVFPAKSLGGWDVVHINEEMEAEGYTLHDLNVSHDDDNEDEQPRLKRRRHEAICESTLDPEEKKVLLSEKWGSLFTDDVRDDLVPVNHQGPHRHMNTFWGWVISQYSDIAIPNIEYIAELPLTHKFKSFRPGVDSQDMLGFHPGVPLSLKKYEDQPDA